MMTKKTFAKTILRKQATALGISPADFNRALSNQALMCQYALQSSCLGVAAAYLGLIEDPDMKEYIAGRAGILFTAYDNEADPENSVQFLTVREILDMLPETIDPDEV